MRGQLIWLSMTLVAMASNGCSSIQQRKAQPSWHLMFAHESEGQLVSGSQDNLIAAVRNGCQIRVAWGNRRETDPSRSIEHVADVKWIGVRNNESISAQIGDFVINLAVLGEPAEEHPRREDFGGTRQVVEWRANLQTDGTFDAVWFAPHSGEFVTRRMQRFPMRWYADCDPVRSDPLYASPAVEN